MRKGARGTFICAPACQCTFELCNWLSIKKPLSLWFVFIVSVLCSSAVQHDSQQSLSLVGGTSGCRKLVRATHGLSERQMQKILEDVSSLFARA